MATRRPSLTLSRRSSRPPRGFWTICSRRNGSSIPRRKPQATKETRWHTPFTDRILRRRRDQDRGTSQAKSSRLIHGIDDGPYGTLIGLNDRTELIASEQVRQPSR